MSQQRTQHLILSLLTSLATPVLAAGYSAELRRTSHGIHHIKAADEKGLGYGVGYAYATQNFCLLAEDLVTVRGERSRYFGPEGRFDRDGGGGSLGNLQADFHYRLVNDAALVQATWDRQSSEVQDLARGYAAGVNRYLSEVGPGGVPAACRNAPWLRAMDALDLMRFMRRYALAGGGEVFIDAYYAAQPPTGAALRRPDSRPEAAAPGFWAQKLGRDRAQLGSNGVALGRDATESGQGMLLANPHFPWTTSYRFWQLHITIPGKVDAFGASLGGFPLVNVGHNAHVAWTHTVNTSTHFTLFKLQLDRRDPTRYVVDGQSRPMTRRDVTVDTGNGQSVSRSLWFTDQGPLVVLPGLLEWTGRTAYALRDANAQNDRMFEQWWQFNRAGSLAELRQSLETLIGTPWVHTIAVDRAGDAYYGDLTIVPRVSAEQQAACIPGPLKLLVSQGLFVLDGARSACRWQTALPGAPQPEVFAASELPSLQRSDWVQNSNDSAWLTNPAQPLVGFPDIVSIDSQPQGGRTRIGLEQIRQRLAGRDGRPGRRFTLDQLQEIAFSNRSYFASVLLADLRSLCAAGTTAPSGADVTQPCGTLARWDGRAELDSVGWPLFDAWRRALNRSGIDYWRVPFRAALGATTPRGLKTADAAVAGAAREALATAVTDLAAQGMDWRRPWGELQGALRGSSFIPVHGGNGADIYNAIDSRPLGDGRFDTFYGSSIVMAISFEGETPLARGWLTFSQSTDPASPYFADQTRLFSSKQWITFPFTDAQIEADPQYQRQVITE
jgi:acyl-homoserine-lactone acylase